MYWQYGMSKAEKQAERPLSMTLTHQMLSLLDPLIKQLTHPKAGFCMANAVNGNVNTTIGTWTLGCKGTWWSCR